MANVTPHENLWQVVGGASPHFPHPLLPGKLGNSFIEFYWLKGIMYATYFNVFFLFLLFTLLSQLPINLTFTLHGPPSKKNVPKCQ